MEISDRTQHVLVHMRRVHHRAYQQNKDACEGAH